MYLALQIDKDKVTKIAAKKSVKKKSVKKKRESPTVKNIQKKIN